MYNRYKQMKIILSNHECIRCRGWWADQNGIPHSVCRECDNTGAIDYQGLLNSLIFIQRRMEDEHV